MKKVLPLFLLCVILFLSVTAQQTFHYPLSGDFECTNPEGPDFLPIQNNQGLTGMFTTRTVPATTCSQGGTAGGYFFEDDAGLQLNIPDGFIEESYSLALIFQMDEFIDPPPWVRILSFTHTDDHGVYIYLTDPPVHGTLEFWPNGTVGEMNFFDTENFYQLILVRNTDGLIKIYINGVEFSEYNDAGTQEYKPQPPENYLIFFRDHPSVLADEASPGFVSNITLTNEAWDQQEVAARWADFCSSLLGIGETGSPEISILPNPVTDHFRVQLANHEKDIHYEMYDLTGKRVLHGEITSDSQIIKCEGIHGGIYFLKVFPGKGSVVRKVVVE
jgi:hypothetical protein